MHLYNPVFFVLFARNRKQTPVMGCLTFKYLFKYFQFVEMISYISYTVYSPVIKCNDWL